MVYKIVIYGYAYGRGMGTGLLDLTYFVQDDVRVQDIFNIIEGAGFKMIAKYVAGRKALGIEQDRVTIEEWDSHVSNITVGKEQMPDEYQVRQQPYDRYSYPVREI
jgi:hypothetical protein